MPKETVTRSATIQVEKKEITVQLVENPRGSCVRFIESNAAGRRNYRMVPASGLSELTKVLQQLSA